MTGLQLQAGALAAVATDADVDNYTIGDDTTNDAYTVTIAASDNVNITSATATDVVSVAVTGTQTGALSLINTAGHTLIGVGTSDVTSLTLSNIDTLNLATGGANLITMTEAQYDQITAGITGASTDDRVTIAAGAITSITTDADVDNYTFGEDNDGNAYTVTVAATDNVDLTSASTDDVMTLAVAGTYTGTLNLGDVAGHTVNVTAAANIAGATLDDMDTMVITGDTNVTMSNTQYAVFDSALTATGDNVITISNAATLTTIDAIEAYSMAAGMTVTVGTGAGSLAQVITETGTEAVSTVTLGNGIYTGDWVGFDAADIVKINASGSDISGNTGLNGGVKLDFQAATANTTLNATQNGVVTFINAGANVQTVNLSAVDTFTTTNTIEAYSGIGGGVVTLAASHTAANIAMTTAGATTLNVGAQTVTGTYALADEADVLKVTATADISGINSGGATTAENLDLTTVALINATMTEAQYDGFTGITANAGNDTITIEAGAIATIATDIDIGTYVIQDDGNDAYTVTIGASDDVNITSATAGDVVSVAVTGTQTGALSLINTDGHTLIGLGTSDVTGLTLSNIDTLNLATGGANLITMTVGFNPIGINLHGDILVSGIIDAEDANVVTDADVDNYTFGEDNDGNAYTVTVAATDNVDLTSASTGDVMTLAVAGTYTGILNLGDVAGHTVNVTAAANIAGATLDDMDTMVITGDTNVTMNNTQYAVFDSALTATGDNIITISNAATLTTIDAIEAYSMAAGMTVTIGTGAGSLAQVITETGTEAVSTVTLGNGIYTGNWVGFDAADIVKINSSGSDISGNTGLNAGVKLDFQAATANTTLNASQNGVVTFINAGANVQTVNVTAADSFTTTNTIEAYSGIGGGVVTLAASHTAVNIAMTTAAATTVNVGAQTVTGTYALADEADVLKVTATADISGINSGGATTAEILDLATSSALINATMTEAQYDGFTGGISADAGNDTITIKAGAITSIVTDVDIGTYVIQEDSDSDAYTVTVGGTDNVNITSASTGDVMTLAVAGTYNGTLNLGNVAGHTVNVTAAANIAGATLSNMDTMVITGNTDVTMNKTQYAVFDSEMTASGTNQITISDDDATLTGITSIQKYVLGNGTNNFTAAANVTNITGGDNADTFVMAAGMVAGVAISGGAGNDTVTITDDTAATDLDNISLVENIDIVGTSASVYTLSASKALIAAGATLDVDKPVRCHAFHGH